MGERSPYNIGGVGQGAGAAPVNGRINSTNAEQTLQRLQARGNGLDFYALSQAPGVQSLAEPLPPLDFRWTWQTPNQRGFALTLNSARGGMEMQRGRVEQAHTRVAQSSQISYARDELILALLTVTQSSLAASFSNQMLLHANFLDCEVMAPYLGFGTTVPVYRETSPSNPTVIGLSNIPGFLYGLATVVIEGVEQLMLLTSAGTWFYRDFTTAGEFVASFNVLSTATPPAAGTGQGAWALGGSGTLNTGIAFPGTQWGGGQSTASYIGQAVIQSPLPGNPLIVRSSNSVLLIPVETSATNSDPYTQTGSLMLSAVGLGACQPIGFQRVGNLPPAAYWWEYSSGGPGQPGFRSRIASVDAYGTNYQVHHLSLAHIIGAAANPQRGSIVVNGLDRVVDWNGRETDLRIFADEPPKPGYKQVCIGVYVKDGQTYAEVNELPWVTGGIAEGEIRACKRRYDYELMKWQQISDWLILTPDGLINWQNGVPIPAGRLPAGPFGYMSAYGGPDLPFGPVTRAMHEYAVQAAYNDNASQSQGLTDQGQVTWFHKFEPPAATNPYSLRGADQNFALSGATRWPAFIFPQGFEYADKYVDGIEYGGQDTGGTGSSVTVRIGEGGHLDDASGWLHRSFPNPLQHADRYQDWPANQTSLLFPQVEIEITRGTANETPQALPVTIFGHIDMREERQHPAWRPPYRSNG